MKIAVGGRVVAVIKLLMLVATLACANRALAQTSDPVAEAKEDFRKGVQLYDLGKYLDAVVEFEAAFRKSDRPGFLLNIGQAYRLGGKPREALAAYQGYLRRLPNAPQRAEAERYIAELGKRVAEDDARLAAQQAAVEKAAAEKAAAERAAAEKAARNSTSNELVIAPSPPVKKKSRAWIAGVVAGVVVVGLGVGLGVGLTVGRSASAKEFLTPTGDKPRID